MLLQATFVYVPADICGRQKITFLLCLRQKTVPRLFVFLHFFQEYETYHSYLMKDCTSVRVEMR